MKKLVHTIAAGYFTFIKNAGMLIGILFIFLILACVTGYPMWYLAINHPSVYTIFGVSFLIVLTGFSLFVKLHNLYGQKGSKGLLEYFRLIGLRIAKTLYLLAGIGILVYLFGHQMIAAGIISLIVLIFITGLTFFKH